MTSSAPAADAALQLLRQLGHRGTAACRHVLNELATSERHLSADELFTSLPAQLQGCDRSTIYRQLTQLERLGIAHAVPGSRATTFGLVRDTEHHHESCLHCGRTIDTAEQQAAGHSHTKPSFLATVSSSVILGICNTCSG